LQRIIALESSRSLGDGELALYLNSTDERIAARAALGIGRTQLAAGIPLLLPHLHDPRTGVRALTVYGLGLIPLAGDPTPFVTALGDPQGAVRVAAVDAIARQEAGHRYAGAADETAAQGALEQALRGDADPIVRARAATALVEFRDGAHVEEAADAIANAYRNDADPSVRWHAMWTIYRGYATGVPLQLVEHALKNRDELVRIEALRAIARRKDPKLIAVVKPLLADASWRVQEQAGEAIRLLSGKPQTEALTAIPAYVHVPPLAPDPYAHVAAIPQPAPTGTLLPPKPDDLPAAPALDPTTTALMTGPAPGPHPHVRIVTTKGPVYLVLYPEWAPLTVENFLSLAARGYYSGNRWFRIVPDFVVQTGDPHDNGEGDAGYMITAEENPIEQGTGVLSMGLNYDDKTQTPIRDSAGTQYYITLSPQLHLDRDFTVFGAVDSGFSNLGRLTEADRVVRIERLPDVVL
jgi:cyclophilin family peptidyl-prolyl cis-trans isomerase/HEAT repeat protein